MLDTFVQAFRIPDLRRKSLFTLFTVAAFRLGSFIPTPGVDSQAVQRCMVQEPEASLLDLANLFLDGALPQSSTSVLGIMPYIIASIIIQLLRVVIPRLNDLHKEGQAGQAKLTQYTRYLTIFLGILQMTATTSLACSGQLLQSCNHDIIKDRPVVTFTVVIIAVTAGAGMTMWLDELITERGIDNDMPLLIFTSITARLLEQPLFIGQAGKWDSVAAIVALLLLVAIAVVYVEQAQCRIPVQYTKRMIGRRQYGGTTTYIPLKTNTSGVIFVIFASSTLALPPMAAQSGSSDDKWVQWISVRFTQGSSFYLTIYALMTLFFTPLYTATMFNPDEVMDNMRKYEGFTPGYRAGRLTVEYLCYVTNRIATADILYLVITVLLLSLAVIPLQLSNLQMPFGGTTLLTIIGVGLQTMEEINMQPQQHHYEGFLR